MIMGSGDWFKNIIIRKKAKEEKHQKGPLPSEKSNGFKWRHRSRKESSSNFPNGSSSANPVVLGMPVEDVAATRIQTAFRAYKARKALRHLKGIVRLQALTQVYTVKKQASTTMDYLHSWIRIQSQIRARRISMVTEGRIKQKKLENQLKLDAKLHELEVEWCGGSETMEDILARMYQREEAAVKRERAMAYAFSHQWRANSSNPGQFPYELGKANWGWSWIERWIAARPWESRVPISPSPKKIQSKQTDKLGRTTSLPTPAVKVSVSVKPTVSNGKGSSKAKRLSYPNTEKPAEQKANPKVQSLSGSETEETNTKQE